MIRVKKLLLTELFCFVNDNIPIHVNIDSENYVCDVEIKADYIMVNKMPTVTIISVGVRDLVRAEVDKHTVTIDTNSYKEIIIL